MRLASFVCAGVGLAAIHHAAAFRGPIVTAPRHMRSLTPWPPSRDGRVGNSPVGGGLSMARNDPFGAILDLFNPSKSDGNATPSSGEDERLVESFVAALNSRTDPSDIVARFFADDVEFVDASYYNPIRGSEALRRHFYLHAGSSALSTFAVGSTEVVAVDDIVAAPAAGEAGKVCVRYHLATAEGEEIADTAAITFYNLRGGAIARVFDVAEPASPKPGDGGLKLLEAVSNLIGDEGIVPERGGAGVDGSATAADRYFDAWNRRDMADAASLFAEDCVVRDLQYDEAFRGREEFEGHLSRVNDCLPGTFEFVVDDVAAASNKVGVSWHVENNGSPLAFTRGCSFYTVDERSGLIRTGFEIPEKAPPKRGYLNTLLSKFEAEPIRYVSVALWVAYMYVVFLSDGILPGANALALEMRTWEEVRDLSLNFFLVSPLLGLPFSPVVHPMLEGVFNLLLAWAAMFAGFLSDERRDKPNLLPFGPMLVGMQFLTSGFLLPYLFARTSETTTSGPRVYREDIDGDLQARVAEFRPLGLLLGGVGSASVCWGLFARPEFGDLGERYASFGDLLGIDRVGSSFLVDLAVFAAFQGWFVDDDLRRRVAAEEDLLGGELAILRNAAKYVPFFGLAAYLMFRPPLPSRESVE